MSRPKQIVVWEGEEVELLVLCKQLDRNPMLVRTRLREGWDVERSVCTPSKFGDKYGRWSNYEQWLERNRKQ